MIRPGDSGATIPRAPQQIPRALSRSPPPTILALLIPSSDSSLAPHEQAPAYYGVLRRLRRSDLRAVSRDNGIHDEWSPENYETAGKSLYLRASIDDDGDGDD